MFPYFTSLNIKKKFTIIPYQCPHLLYFSYIFFHYFVNFFLKRWQRYWVIISTNYHVFEIEGSTPDVLLRITPRRNTMGYLWIENQYIPWMKGYGQPLLRKCEIKTHIIVSFKFFTAFTIQSCHNTVNHVNISVRIETRILRHSNWCTHFRSITFTNSRKSVKSNYLSG